MKEQKVDHFIQETLRKETDSAVNNKDELWNAIEKRLDEIDSKSVYQQRAHRINRLSKRKNWMAITATIAGLFLVIVFTTTTEQGQAFMKQVSEWFAPQKSINQELEGMQEKTKVNLQQKQTQSAMESDFVIYVDEERYHLLKEKGQFRITVDLPDKYPEVYMDITQQIGEEPADVIKEIKNRIAPDYQLVGEIEQVKTPVTGYRLRADQGNKKWSDEVVVYYVVSNKQNGSFIIKQKYFLEASEGHGVRFDNMLKEFKVIPKEK